jgi:hypothetical protein
VVRTFFHAPVAPSDLTFGPRCGSFIPSKNTEEKDIMWTRRDLIGTALAGGTGVALMARGAGAQQDRTGDDHASHDVMWKTCCDTCADCAKACNKAFHHCLTQAALAKGQHARMAQTLADCAAFCALSAEMLARHSTLALYSCAACADACKRCAQECESFDTDMEMKSCQQECLRCEESCRKMIQSAGTGRPGEASPAPARRSNRRPN